MSNKPTYKELEQRVKEMEEEAVRREKTEEALRESEEIFRLFMEHSPVYTFFKDENIRSLKLSRNYEQMLGIPIDELIGKTMDEIFPSNLAKSMIANDKRILKEGKTETVTEELDGRYYETTKFPIYVNDKPKYLAGFTMDVTERKRTEEMLKQRSRDLNERVKELNCLYSISNLVERPDISLEEIFQGVVELIPPSWQYPEITCSCFVLKDEEYKTENFRKTEWRMVSNIFVHGEKVGYLEVFYLEERPEIDEGPFLGEERNLINAITGRLGRIIERIQAAEALRVSEGRLSSFMNSASDGMYLLDSKLNFVEINKSGLEVIGKNKEEVIGKNIAEIVPNVKESGRYEKHLEVLKTGRQFEVEDFIPHPVFGDLHFNLISFKAGDGLGLIARDITRRKKALERVERLNNLNETLIIPDSLEAELKRITESVVEIFGADFCRIWCTMGGDICDSGCSHADVTEGPHVCRNREHCLHLMASSGRYTHVDGGHRRVPLGAYKIGRIASGEEDFIINDISSDPEIHDKKWAKEHGLVSFAGYRLLSAHGDVIGVMALFSKKDISPDDHALLKGVANTTAKVIQGAISEEELRKSEARFRGLVETSSDFIWEVNSEGVYTYVSPKIKDLLGYEPEDVIGKRPFDLMPVEETGRVGDIFRINAEQGTPIIRLENLNQHKKGHHIVLETSGVPIIDKEGNILGYRGIDRDITDRKQAEVALRESEERYRTLISKMLNGFALHEIICDETGKPIDYRFLEVNSTFEEMTGLKSVKIIGKTVLEVLPETESYWIDTYGKVALTGESIKFDNYSKAFDRYYEVLAYSPKKGQFAAVFTDITERRKTEQALRFTQFAIDRYSDGAFWMGPDAHIIYVNDAACRSLGYSRDELLKMKINDFDPDFSEEAWQDHWADLKRRGSIIFDSHHQRKDGAIFPVEISASYVKFGEEEYNCAFARDVSERKKEETEKENLRNRLQKALRMESIANLAGGVAHQFNNALSPITTNLDLLELDLSDDEDMVKSIEQMRRSAKRMALLTSQLLAYARGGKYSPVIISPSDFVRNTLPLIEHNVHPDVNIDTDLPHDILPIKCDSTQMQMVLSVVIQNSSEAIAGKGRIKITSKNEKIDKTSDYINEGLDPGLYVSLTVEDNGKGMDEETKNRIFEPFFTTKFQGRGLGMAAVYGIIENHKGFILIDTELGKGTTVRIFLPAVKDKLKGAKKKKFEPVKGKGNILLIEDEEDVMDVSRKLLERLGYSVLEAKTGKEAINIANTFEGKIQLAILDIILPDMGGKAIYDRIMEALPDLKVIVCSGYSINGPAREILDKGAQDFIQKPLDLQKLSEKLEEVLSK